MRMKHVAVAGAALLLSAGTASAAVVTNGLNLRNGPGTGYGIIDTMPAGAHVRLLDCGAHWCHVSWNGERGYASRSYLAGGRVYAYEPPPVYAQASPFSFGPGWNNDWDGGWNSDWDGGWHHDWDGGWGHYCDDDD
jgi:hypothetical protein